MHGMMEELKLIVMTVTLTLLVWAGADSLVNESVVVRLSFEAAPRDDSDVVVELPPTAKAQLYELVVSGPRRAAEQVQRRERYPVRLRIEDRPPGEHSLTLTRDLLKNALSEQWSDFRQLRMVSIDPPSLPLTVDRMVDTELDLTARALTLPYETPPQWKRSTVTLRGRQSLLDPLTRDGQKPQLDISAELERQLRGKPPGRSATVTIALDHRPFGPGAELKPSSVEVTATVKSQRDTADIPAVPIRFLISPSSLATAYAAVTREGTPLTLVTRTVRVAGSPEDIARLQRGETKAFGFIQLKETDFQQLGVLRTWTPEYILPPNLELEGVHEPIEFMLVVPARPGEEKKP